MLPTKDSTNPSHEAHQAVGRLKPRSATKAGLSDHDTDASRFLRLLNLRLDAIVAVARCARPDAESALLVRRDGTDRVAFFSMSRGDEEVEEPFTLDEARTPWTDLADELASKLPIDDLDDSRLDIEIEGWRLHFASVDHADALKANGTEDGLL